MPTVISSDILKKADEIMMAKQKEYAPGEDRLQNIRMVAEFQGAKMSQVALTYLLKHIQSITVAVEAGVDPDRWQWTMPDGSEGLLQRFADAINYLQLLAMCIDDELGDVRYGLTPEGERALQLLTGRRGDQDA